MSIASEITRLQGVKADILSAIADKGVEVPSDSMLDDCPSLIGSIAGGGGDNNYVHIGSRDYHYIQIGNLFWIDENLDEKFNISEDESDMTYERTGYQRILCNNVLIEQTSLGRMYNNLALGQIEKHLPSGWRIPTEQDFSNLIAETNDDLLKLCCTYGILNNNFKTNNELKFNLLFGSCRTGGKNTYSQHVFSNVHFWCKFDTYSSTPYIKFSSEKKVTYYMSSSNYVDMKFVRLCKDA